MACGCVLAWQVRWRAEETKIMPGKKREDQMLRMHGRKENHAGGSMPCSWAVFAGAMRGKGSWCWTRAGTDGKRPAAAGPSFARSGCLLGQRALLGSK